MDLQAGERARWRARLLRALPGLLFGCAALELLWTGAWVGGPEAWPLERAPRLATAACLLALAAPLSLLAERSRAWVALGVNALLSSLVVIDLIHHRYLGEPTSATELSHLWQLSQIGESLTSALRAQHALVFLDVVLGLGVLLASCDLPSRTPARRWRRAGVLLACALVAGGPVAWLVARDPEQVLGHHSSRRSLVRMLGLLPYHLDELGWLSRRLGDRAGVSERERALVVEHLGARDPGPPGELSGSARGANVILIQVESWHAFALQARIGGRPVMPRLERFRRECLSYSLYDQTGEGATSDAAFMALQSLHPSPRGAVATRYYANRFHGLPHLLRAQGYATLTAVGAVGEYWNMARMRSGLGFERALFARDFPGESFGQGVSDPVVLRGSLAELRALRQPFLAFLVTLSSHHPYRLPAEHRTLDVGELEGTLLGDYLQSMSYVDEALGEFLESLRREGLLERSLVVIYGDHQAWLDETPDLARLCGYPPGDRLQGWLTRRRLPLLIRTPRARARGVRALPAGHLDLAPTVLGFLGQSPTQSVFLGRDLTRSQARPVALRDGSFVSPGLWFLNRPGPLEGCEAFGAEGQALPLAPLEQIRAEVARELAVSDAILAGDLIPELLAR